ncbi:MAG: cation transporting ATPase C-terminal domain-containing protein, partial [Planctomycetota bacterium]
MAVTAIVLFQVFYLFMSRSLTRSVLSMGLWSNQTIYIGVAAILVLQGLFVYLPVMNGIFHSAPLPAREWLELVLVALTVIPVVALQKWAWRRFSRQPQPTATG